MPTGDVGNRREIGDCESDISKLCNDLPKNASHDRYRDDEIRELRQEVDQPKMCFSALSRVLVAKGVLTEVNVIRYADLIDAGSAIDANQSMRFLDDQD